mmetsp:Transcript_26343/g.23294  ORF Transcript_26343/g.23294 Transcript_26343/m.23294 type:complete len:169 (-) Transcript_26343:215-721(-)
METTGENTIIDSSTLLPPEPTLEEAGSEEILALMFKAREKFCEAMSILSEDGWTTIKEGKGTSLEQKKSPEGGVNLIKRVSQINAPAAKVYDWFCEQSNLCLVSDRLKVSEVVHEFNETTRLVKREVKGNFIVTNRDLCIFWHKLALTDGAYCNCQFSIEHEKIPETK